jgi:hypothetical protein
MVYLMWRIQPREEVVIQVKRDGEYNPIARHPFVPYRSGETHELLARVRVIDGGGCEVQCWIDWQEIPRTLISPELIQGIDGPPGIRTDNGRYGFRYFVDSNNMH